MSDKDIIIIGASGFGKEVAWLAEQCGRKVLGFFDDNKEYGKEIYNYTILGGLKERKKYKNCEFIIGIGNPRIRKSIATNFKDYSFATLIHPSVNLSSTVSVDTGSVICEGNTLTVDISIGKHTHINLNSTIGHDCKIGDFVTIAPLSAISGNVEIGDGAEIGTAAAIRQGVYVGTGSMIGMGGVVTKELNTNSIYIGSPARFFKQLDEF